MEISTNTPTTNFNNILTFSANNAYTPCCIPGDRLIKVFSSQEAKRGEEINISTFFHDFHEEDSHFIDSFNRKICAIERKLITKVTTRFFTGQMIKLMLEYEEKEEGLSFVCTEDHYVPMEIINELNEAELYIGRANVLSPWTPIFRFLDGQIVKQRACGVATYEVKDLEVFNLELGGPASFYVDVKSGVIHNY